MKLNNSSRSFAWRFWIASQMKHCSSIPPTISLLLLSFHLCVTSHFISIPLSPLPNKVLGMGGGIMCAGFLICHMGPWSCNQNRFWANLYAPFGNALSYTHRVPGLSRYPFPHSTPNVTNMPNKLLLFHKHYIYLYNAYPINDTDSCRVYLNMYMEDRLYLA